MQQRHQPNQTLIWSSKQHNRIQFNLLEILEIHTSTDTVQIQISTVDNGRRSAVTYQMDSQRNVFQKIEYISLQLQRIKYINHKSEISSRRWSTATWEAQDCA